MSRLFALVAACFVCCAAHAAPACPAGDAPGDLGAFVIADVATTVTVADGVGHLDWRVVLRNTGAGPASIALDFATATDGDDDGNGAQPIINAVRLGGHSSARLVDVDAAAEAFDSFTTAIENGVDVEEAVAGKSRAGLHAHLEQGRGVIVDVAAACSQRQVVVLVRGSVLTTSRSAGERLLVPRLTRRDRITVNADDADVWAAGLPLPADRVVRVVDALDGPDEDDDGADALQIELRPHTQRLQARGLVRAFGAQTLVQANLSIPMPMSSVPDDVHIVFVVDASVSAGAEGVALALRLVDRVLDEAPAQTRWSLITAARVSRLVVGPWRARDDRFIPDIIVGNGSDVPAAIRMATAIASDVDGAARVVVLSDLQLATGHEATLTAALMPAPSSAMEPVLHVVQLPADADDSGLQWQRITDEPVAIDTERRGGVYVRTAHDGDNDEHSLARYLVRPTRLDDLQLFVDGQPFSDDSTALDAITVYDRAGGTSTAWPHILGEGEGLRMAELLSMATARVELRGRAWSTPVVLPIASIDAVATAGVVLNGPRRGDLEPEFVALVANRVGFVSSATSFVDVPRWRPARGDGGGMSSSSTCGCGGMGFRCGGGFRCGVGRAAVVLQARAILDAAAADIADRCRADVDADLEVGDLEVLAVDVTAANAKQGRCVREHLWQLRLDQLTPGDGSFEAHDTFAIKAGYTASVDDDAGDQQ